MESGDGAGLNPSAEATALVGAVLNQRYRLTAVLGEGGLASVFRAEPNDGAPAVAVKLLKSEFKSDPEVVERFLAEATLAERIQHPGVVRVFGGFRAEDGSPYLVTELLVGHALSQTMNRGPVPVEQAVQIALALLETLAAAHAVGVVHRDIKPDNVFVCPGQERMVRLLDFGISRAIEAAGGSARKTKTGMLLGTPGYMSPEQVKNSKDADHRSDLFSIGVLFYELITGQRAFEGQTEYERMMAVLFGDARPIEQTAPQFAHWQSFFAKALEREPTARFQNAMEMRDALSAVATGGNLPERRFGGESTAVSPVVGREPVAPVPDVRIVPTPRRVMELRWVFVVAGLSWLIGFVLGYLVTP